MKKNIGLIGSGNMAEAIIGGIIRSKVAESKEVMASDFVETRRKKMKETFGILVTEKNIEVAKFSDVLILAVKPDLYEVIIDEIKDVVKEEVIIVVIAAGITIEFMENAFERNIKIIRTMPNTPAMVGEGMTAICGNDYITKKELDLVVKIFQGFGKTEIIEENLMDAIPAVSGSSPAYVYMFIEALGDGAVLRGIPREQAYKLAAQAVFGAAKMVLETGEHPGVLKDNVCSPGGSTIEAVFSLEKNNFRGAIIEAMEVCTKKVVQMTEKNK